MASLAFFFLKNALMSVMIFAAAGHGARNIGELQHYHGCCVPTNPADQNMMMITSSTPDHVIPLAKGDARKPCCTRTVRNCCADDRTTTGHVIPLEIAGPRKPCCTIAVRKCCRNDTTHSAAAEALISTVPAKP